MRKASTLGLVSAGLLLAASPAHAATSMTSSGNIGVANGNQVSLPVQVPVNFCGNAIGILGSASASCTGGAAANYATGHGGGMGGGTTTMNSVFNPGVLNGTQVAGMVQVPVNFCGNAIGILGSAMASCVKSGATANAFTGGGGHVTHRPPMPYTRPKSQIAPSASSKIRSIAVPRKERGILAGLLSPVTGLLGTESKSGYGHPGGGGTCGPVSMTSSGNIGVGNGNQVHAPVQVPINFAGNAISVLGGPTMASAQSGASASYC